MNGSASNQLSLCSRIIYKQCLAEVLDYGITDADFTTPEGKKLWVAILVFNQSQATRGSIMDEWVVQQIFPGYQVPTDRTGIATHALCHAVRRERVYNETNKALQECSNSIAMLGVGTDAMSPLTRLQTQVSTLISLGCTANSDVSFLAGLGSVRTRMHLLRQGVDLSIMKWPWEAMNRATLGVQKDDYVVFYGRPKSMKTWVLARLAAWCYENDKKIVLYTKEMTPDNIYQRVTACICQIVYASMRDGLSLTEAEWLRFEDLYNHLLLDPTWASMITVLNGRDAPPGGDNVSWLASKIDKHKPAVAFIDGLYLLSDQNKKTKDNERVMSISRDLRSMNLGNGVPIIATMQANRKAAGHSDANLDEIAYSDALSQDCTAAIRTIQRKEQPSEEEKQRDPNVQPKVFIDLVFGGSREYTIHGLRLHGKPAVDFTQVKELNEADVLASREADEEAQEERKAARAKKRKAQKNQTSTDSEINQAAAASSKKTLARPELNGRA
jgi:hypothetical protein